MTDLRTAALRALEFIRWSQFVPCQSGDFPEPPSTAPQIEAALVAALAGSEWREHAPEYEKGFIDGMSEQARRSVDRAINAMAQPIIQPEIKVDKETRWLPMPWKGLTVEEHNYYKACGFVGVSRVEEVLRAKNSV